MISGNKYVDNVRCNKQWTQASIAKVVGYRTVRCIHCLPCTSGQRVCMYVASREI
jgi:hypothetical protein